MATVRVRQNNMSVAHSGVSFNHSCLKVPVDPKNKRPSPNYERVYNYKLSSDAGKGRYRGTSAVSSNSSLENNYKSVESYLQFYETIPDYSELHHLSDEEFYSRLKSLKITQKRFCSGADEEVFERPSSHSSIGFGGKYNPEGVYGKAGERKKDGRVSSGYSNSSGQASSKITPPKVSGYVKKMKTRWGKAKPPKINVISDSENVSELGVEGKDILADDAWKKNGSNDECWISDDGCSRKSKSMPSSPGWKTKICGCAPVMCGFCWHDR